VQERSDKKKGEGGKWYEKPLVLPMGIGIISIIATAVTSLIAAYAVYYGNSSKLEFDERARLTVLIQQLSETREKIAELALQYGDKAPIPSVELRQPIIEEAVKLLENANASPFQKMVLAESLNDTNQPYRAEPIASQAVKEAEAAAEVETKAAKSEAKAEAKDKNLVDKVLAAQVLAVAYFNQGKVEDGRQAYRRALKYAENAITVDSLIRELYQLETEQFWISSELRINNCTRAKERLQALELHSGRFPESLRGEAEKRVQPTHDRVDKVCPSAP
jgi:tetratricopeptide (TPR) repeat protein